MLASDPRFPYSFIRQHPMFDHIVSKSDENLLHRPVQFAAVECILSSRVNDLAIHVELKLITGGVPNAYWTRSFVALQVETAFSGSQFPVDGISSAQFGLGEPGGMQHPIHEVIGLFPISQTQQS